MREILFKAKRLDNGEWVKGSLISTEDNSGFILQSKTKAFIPKGANTFCSTECYEIDPTTLCQYTGLTDKNGKRIWENDIVEHEISSVLGAVEWYAEDYVGWWVNDEYLGKQQFTDEMWDECVVIGNIFDNPELLGGAE